MTSEVRPSVGAVTDLGDTLVRYRLGTHKPCQACGHRHRFDAPDGEGGEIVFDAACPECPCRANGARFDAGIYHDIDQYDRPRCAAHDLPTVDDDDCDSSTGPRVVGHRDAGGTHRLDAGRRMRRVGLGWFVRLCLPGFTRDQRAQLVDEGRMESSARRRSGDSGLANHGGGEDPDDGSGRVGVCSLVGPRGWMA